MRAHLEIKEDGGLLMSGLFKSVDSKPRLGYAMLLPNGGLDESFEPWRGTTNPVAPGFAQCATFLATLLTDGGVAAGNDNRRRPAGTLSMHGLSP